MNTTAITINQSTPSFIQDSQKLIGIAAIAGGLLIIIGTLLPWFSLLAGLHTYSGIVGLNGRILLFLGILCAVVGGSFLARGGIRLRYGISLLGIILLGFSAWLAVGMWQTLQQLGSNPLMVPRIGPGLFVVFFGALILSSTIFLKYKNENIKRGGENK